MGKNLLGFLKTLPEFWVFSEKFLSFEFFELEFSFFSPWVFEQMSKKRAWSKEWKWFLWAVFSAVFFLPVYLTVYKLSKVILSTAERTVLKSWRQFLSGQDNLLTAFVYLLRWLDRIIARLFGCIQVVKHPEKNPLCLPRT